MKWMLVTGAGASRELGRERPLPLMTDWAASVCTELDSREEGLARAIGLTPEMASDEFERALGAVTSWRRARALAPRFFGLTGTRPNEIPAHVPKTHEKETGRLDTIIEGIRTSLYAEFGTDRIDEGAAAAAYETLLGEIGNPQWLVCATTNYDPSVELALELLGRGADTGVPEAACPDSGACPIGSCEGGCPIARRT